MKTSTRLIVLLMLMVGGMMLVRGWFSLHQRKAILETAMHNEVRAHAQTLQIALQGLFRAGRTREAQQLIDSLSENPRVYGVVLFDAQGQMTMLSNPLVADEVKFPAEVREVLQTGQPVEMVRKISNEEVFSIILPIRGGDSLQGAFEIAQPMSFIRADYAAAQREIATVTLTLFALIILVVYVVMRRGLFQPIQELLRGAAALGRGDLYYRVIVPGRDSEFVQLADEFNRMADSLEEQRENAAREAETRLALERKLRHSERLASVGRLAAGVAHELGTPLNVVDARAEQLLAENELPERRVRNVTIIRAQVERMARIVRQLLNLARPYDLHVENLDLNALISEVLELMDTQLKDAEIRTEFVRHKQVVVSGDRAFLFEVISNIILNAVQAMPTGGRLRVECAGNLLLDNQREFATVRITDTGKGIDPQHLPHLFDPFFTTRDIGSGTGLGLAVAHRIVTEHGGWIEADNDITGGALFIVSLPQSAAAALTSDLPVPQSEEVKVP